MAKEKLEWKVNTPQLLKEIVNFTKEGDALSQPLSILGQVLAEVAQRAAELEDPKLNHLMCRLALYEVCDPYSKEYDHKVVDKLKREAHQ